MWKIWFSVTVLLLRPFHTESPGDSFLDLNLYSALVYLFHHYFSKEVFERNFWEKVFFFWTFDNLVTFSIFLCYLYFSFTDMTIVLVVAKNSYSVKESFFFLESCVHSKNKQLFCQIFPEINFLIKPFLISTFNPAEALNKWTGRHITEERAKNKKNDQILTLHKSSVLFFTKRPIWEPHKPTELVQILTVTNTHRTQKAFPQGA